MVNSRAKLLFRFGDIFHNDFLKFQFSYVPWTIGHQKKFPKSPLVNYT